jgi:hypothetical protein
LKNALPPRDSGLTVPHQEADYRSALRLKTRRQGDLHGCTSRLPVQSCVDTQFVVRRMVAEAAKQL